MGYYSNYVGGYNVVGKITKKQNDVIKSWFFKRFGKYKIRDERVGDGYGCAITKADNHETSFVYLGDIVYDYEEHMVIPTCTYMKGYDFNQHLYEAVSMMKDLGLSISGHVYRTGEDEDDREKIEVISDRVMYSEGKIVWDQWKECTETEKEKNVKFEKMYNEMKQRKEMVV